MLKEHIQRQSRLVQSMQNEMLKAIWLLVRTFIVWPIGFMAALILFVMATQYRGDPPTFNPFRVAAHGVLGFANYIVRDVPPGQVRVKGCEPGTIGDCTPSLVSEAEAVEKLSDAFTAVYGMFLVLSLLAAACELCFWLRRQWQERQARKPGTP